MAKVQGVKEKLHSPLYDAFFVPSNRKNFSGAHDRSTNDPVLCGCPE